MKRYLISGAADLSFTDGRRVQLVAGIHSHPDDVAAHWAFKHLAEPLDVEQISIEPEKTDEPLSEPEKEADLEKDKKDVKK